MLNDKQMETVLGFQKNEITEYLIYKRLAGAVKIREQSDILGRISKEESAHYAFFKKITGKDVAPDNFKVIYHVLIARIFGLNFSLRLMENGENSAQGAYAGLKDSLPEITAIIQDEDKHETELLDMIDEDHLKYMSSVILGINDALIEFTASLAGFTLALQNAKLIGVVGMIMGVAASTSMAASEYLSVKHEGEDKNPLKAAVYTGGAYILVVFLLVMPYLMSLNLFVALGIVIALAIFIIWFFTFYTAVAQGLDFKKRFIEMAGLSLGTAFVTFLIGMVIRKVFGIDV